MATDKFAQRFQGLTVRLGLLFVALVLLHGTATPAVADSFGSLVYGQSVTGVEQAELSLYGHTLLAFQETTQTDNGIDVSVSTGQDQGLFLLDEAAAVSIAMTFDAVDFDSDDPVLPSRLSDIFLGGGVKVAETDQWRFDVIAGAGYAGTRPFADTDAIYGRVSVSATHPLNEQSSLMLIVDYNGNRAYLPDVPLPGVVYEHTVSDQLWYWAGYPYGLVKWQPADKLEVKVDYDLFNFHAEATASYELHRMLSLYGNVATRSTSAFIDGSDGKDRVHFTQNRVEGGVVVSFYFAGLIDGLEPVLDLVVAGGYAFDQDVTFGRDYLNTRSTTQIGDGPYLRVGIGGGF